MIERGACVVGVMLGVSVACEAQVARVPHFAVGSPIEELAAAFRAGHAPDADSLIGTWKVERHVATESFITGRSGPDRIFHESATVAFRRDSTHQLRANYTFVRRWTTVKRNADRDIVFDSDDSGDVETYWSCRISKASHLVCFDLAHMAQGAADAIEFVKAETGRSPSRE